MYKIFLGKGKYAVVDDQDWNLDLLYSWHFTHGYARTTIKKGITRYLHQIIGDRIKITGEVDHENGNKLDCQRSNLRRCTRTQNNANHPRRCDNTTGIKGVSWDATRQKYLAQIRVRGQQIFIGRFDLIEEASDAYIKAARFHFGEFARQ